jgi:hypothetical protein
MPASTVEVTANAGAGFKRAWIMPRNAAPISIPVKQLTRQGIKNLADAFRNE